MAFAGIEDDKERADVIDYLHSLSHSTRNRLPSARCRPSPGSPLPAPAKK